jgi:hypothetical protein
MKTHFVFLPINPTAEMLRIMADTNTPFIARAYYKRDGTRDGYEVVKAENEDWRTTVPVKHKRISRHRSWSAACHRQDVEVAKWKYAQLIALGG